MWAPETQVLEAKEHKAKEPKIAPTLAAMAPATTAAALAMADVRTEFQNLGAYRKLRAS